MLPAVFECCAATLFDEVTNLSQAFVCHEMQDVPSRQAEATQQELWQAAAQGNMSQVQQLLQQGASAADTPDAVCRDGHHCITLQA